MVIIVDYKMGNIRSLVKKLELIKIKSIVSSDKDEILSASKLILPGVGYFAEAMKNLKDLDLIPILNKKVLEDKTPILGIQLLTKYSEEGDVNGLGFIDAKTKRFTFADDYNLRIPHVGWNDIKLINSSILFKEIDIDLKYYFTHSYFIECDEIENVITTTDYGSDFHSSIQRENVYGTQFHPEKSHINGLNILKNFINLS